MNISTLIRRHQFIVLNLRQTVRTGYNILYSTTNQYDTIGVARASDDVSPDTPTADET